MTYGVFFPHSFFFFFVGFYLVLLTSIKKPKTPRKGGFILKNRRLSITERNFLHKLSENNY